MAGRKKPVKRSSEAVAIESENDDDGATQPKVSKELLVIAQEVKIVRALASNDVAKRNRQLGKLRKWFKLRACSSFPFNEDDFMRLWKGLYYNMWMSDKPLVQEELAEQLAQMVDSFSGNTACSLAYFSAFMRTMCQEWFGIDQWRMDKFLMLVRRMLRYMLRLLKANKWSPELIETFNSSMEQSVLAEEPKSRGLTMHYLDVFFEELAKAANEDISAEQVNLFLRPFVIYMGTQRDGKLISQCRTRVFYHLLYQSHLGRDYTDKYNAWKQMGFPTTSIDDVEKVDSGFDEEDDDANQEERPTALDPRAGNVDVYMPELPLNADCVLDELQTLLRTRDYNSKRRKGLRKLMQTFETYKGGEFPLGVRTMPRPENTSVTKLIQQKVAQLNEMEDEVYGTTRRLKKLNKSKRKRLLQSINFEEVDENNYDEIIDKALPPELKKQGKRNAKVRTSMNNAWIVEEINEPPKKKKKTKAKVTEEEPQEKVGKKTAKKSNKKVIKKPTVETSNLDIPAKAAVTDPESETPEKPGTEKNSIGWDAPLKEGESEFFVPSRKQQLKQANSKLLLNPAAVAARSTPTPPPSIKFSTPQESKSAKRVRIVTQCNSAYPKSDYIRQLKLSPQVPYDADRLPGKSALKAHVLPGPIHPNFKAKRLFENTL